MMGYKIINIKDIYNTMGETKTKDILSNFKCELNKDVEYFIHQRAIEFSKQDIAETFIVTASYQQKEVIVGYFAIANKVTNVKKSILSNTKRKRLSKYARYDIDSHKYIIALPLIGQLSKNFYNNYNELISGDVLLKMACDKIKEAQNILGGRFVFLECEDKMVLREFYESNGFVCFGKRGLEKEEREKNSGEYLLQMLKDLRNN